MKYFKNEYPNNIIIFDQDTNKVVCRLMHYDFNNEEEAIEQAEAIVNSLNKEEKTEKNYSDFKNNVEETHEKLREILIENNAPEYGDCIIDEISNLFKFPDTTEIIDLFEFYEDQPENVKSILTHYEDLETLNYEELAGLQKNLETIGYTFDYGLDAQPYNLRKI